MNYGVKFIYKFMLCLSFILIFNSGNIILYEQTSLDFNSNKNIKNQNINPIKAEYEYSTTASINPNAWFYVYSSLSSGDYIEMFVESSSSGQSFDFFICNSYNYNEWQAGRSSNRYEINNNMHILLVDFSIPSTDTWYFVVYNSDSTSIIVEINFDEGGDEIPNISYSADKSGIYTVYPTKVYYLEFTYSENSEFDAGFECFSEFDVLTMAVMDKSTFDYFLDGYSVQCEKLYEDYRSYNTPKISLSKSGTFYLVFFTSESDTVTFSWYFNYYEADTPTDDGGLEPYVIAIIVIGSALLIGIVGLVVIKRKKNLQDAIKTADFTDQTQTQNQFQYNSNYLSNQPPNQPLFGGQPDQSPESSAHTQDLDAIFPITKSENLQATPLQSYCVSCGKSNPLYNKFCQYCGSKII